MATPLLEILKTPQNEVNALSVDEKPGQELAPSGTAAVSYLVVYRSNESHYGSLQQAYQACANQMGTGGYLMNLQEVEQSMQERVELRSALVIGRDFQEYALLIKKLA